MVAKITFLQSLNSDKPSPKEKIREILRSSYDYQADHIFNIDRVQNRIEINEITFYLDECDQPARTRETMRRLQDLIEDYL